MRPYRQRNRKWGFPVDSIDDKRPNRIVKSLTVPFPMIEKMRDGCPMTGTEHGELRRLGFVGAGENSDKNRHDMSKGNPAEVFAKLIFQQALVNCFGMAYTLLHKTSLLIRLFVVSTTAVYS